MVALLFLVQTNLPIESMEKESTHPYSDAGVGPGIEEEITTLFVLFQRTVPIPPVAHTQYMLNSSISYLHKTTPAARVKLLWKTYAKPSKNFFPLVIKSFFL